MDSTILAVHHPLALSMQGAMTMRAEGIYFVQENHIIFTSIHGLHSPNSVAPGRETGQFLLLVPPQSHSLSSIEGEIQGVYCLIKSKLSSFNFPTFYTVMSQNMRPLFYVI
jgi:hypothetical protein